MANMIYTHPSENVAPSASLAVTAGVIDSNYPLANLIDRIYAKPAKSTGTGLTFTATFGAPQQIKLVGFGGQHKLVGATVTLTNNASMAAQTITIPANREDGQSVKPWKDLSAVANNTASVWTFTITGAATVVWIGELEMYSTKRSLPYNPAYGFADEEVHPIIEHATDFGYVKPPYDLATTWRTLTGLRIMDTVANIAIVQAWHRACYGRVKSCLVVLDPAVNDARFVRFLEPKWAHVLSYPDLHQAAFALEEVSPGPAPS